MKKSFINKSEITKERKEEERKRNRERIKCCEEISGRWKLKKIVENSKEINTYEKDFNILPFDFRFVFLSVIRK